MSKENRIDKALISNYRPKDCDFSASEICMPNAQLWAKVNTIFEEDKEIKKIGMKSFIGSAVHSAFEAQDNDGVIQELSWVRTLPDGTRIGGTTDRLDYNVDLKKWEILDIKVKGDYSMKKFLGINTAKAIKEGNIKKPDTNKEIIQLSIYRWLFEDMFNIHDIGTILLIAAGHVGYYKYPEYQEYPLTLMPINVIDYYIKNKIKLARQKEQPEKDCPEWLCKFCDFSKVCNYYKEDKESNIENNGFKSEETEDEEDGTLGSMIR